MSSGKYFRALVRAVPSKYALKGNSFDDQPVFRQHSIEELNQYNLVGLPFYFNHQVPVNISDKEEGKPVSVKYNDSMQLGRVVYKTVSNDGSMMCMLEISPEPAVSGGGKRLPIDEARMAQKDAVIKMIQGNYLGDVSFTHYNDQDFVPDLNLGRIQKLPIEISVVKEGVRDGSKILTHFFSDDPFLEEKAYKNFKFDHYASAATTGVDYNNISLPDPDSETMSGIPPVQMTPDEIAKLLEQVRKLEQEKTQYQTMYNEAAPAAEQFKKKKQEELQQRQQALTANFSGLFETTQKLLEMVKSGAIDIGEVDSATKDTIEYVSKTIPEQKTAMTDGIKNFYATDPSKKGEIDFETAYSNVDKVFGNAAAAMSVCSKLFELSNKQMESVQKLKAKELAGKATSSAGTAIPKGAAAPASAAPVASQAQKRKAEEPVWGDWNSMKESAKKFKSKLVVNESGNDDDDLPPK